MTSGMFLGNGVGVVPTYPTLKRGANKHRPYGTRFDFIGNYTPR
jgi:hypothetical protein